MIAVYEREPFLQNHLMAPHSFHFCRYQVSFGQRYSSLLQMDSDLTLHVTLSKCLFQDLERHVKWQPLANYPAGAENAASSML